MWNIPLIAQVQYQSNYIFIDFGSLKIDLRGLQVSDEEVCKAKELFSYGTEDLINRFKNALIGRGTI